jgi:cytoplasmic FMR1 interacting protein
VSKFTLTSRPKPQGNLICWIVLTYVSILLDKSYKVQLETVYSAHRLHVPRSRYDVILRQRHVQLLGRSVDLNHLIGQRMNTYLRQNIDYAISRFEASDITGVVVSFVLSFF